MNKQQLANKIWESANKMRSKIEANEYKDYILGFIFYKYLSDNEVRFLRQNGVSDAEMPASLVEEDADTTRSEGLTSISMSFTGKMSKREFSTTTPHFIIFAISGRRSKACTWSRISA